MDLKYRKDCFADKTTIEDLADRTTQKQQQTWKSDNIVRCSSHWVKVYRIGLEIQTCEMTLALAYVLYCLSAIWS